MIDNSIAATKILIVGAESNKISLTVKTLEGKGYEVAIAPFNVNAIEHLQDAGLPSLAIIDTDESKLSNGISFSITARKIIDIPTLFIIDKSSINYILDIIHPTIDDFMFKPIIPYELTMRTKWLLERFYKGNQPPINLQHLNSKLRINYIHRCMTDGKKKVFLSTQEAKLLHILHQNAGKLVCSSDIEMRLWPNVSKPSKAATNLRVSIMRLRNKINQAFDCPKLILTKAKYGYWLDSTT